MEQLDTSVEYRIGRNWKQSLALVALFVCLLPALAYLATVDAHSYYEHRAKSGSTIALIVLVPTAIWVAFRLVVPFGTMVCLSADGFADRRINSVLIPWTDITNVVNKGPYVTLTLSRRLAKTYRLSFGQRALKYWRKSAGPRHVLIADWCLPTPKTVLFDLINAYREAHKGAPA